jgi:RNA polymerase sigma-70 factor, ECF subfamily
MVRFRGASALPSLRRGAGLHPMRERPLDIILPGPYADADRRGALPAATPRTLDDASVDAMARAAAAGDVGAVGLLYDELVGPIYRYVALRLRRREDAEDITQLVFERIVAGLPRYRTGRSPFAAWAFRIARNAVIDHVRRDHPTEPLNPIHDLADGAEVEALSLRGEQIRELRQAMAYLTPDQQEALALRFVAGLSAEEAAQAMGRRAGTIRGLTFRAIGALRRHLAGEEGEA